MQTRSVLFLLALCTCAQVAAAAVAAGSHPPVPAMRPASASQAVLTAGVTAEQPRAQARGDVLIRTADTREAPARAQPIATVARAPAEPAQEPPRRTGTVMLLTALAVMFAIALRRMGGAGQ